jgi:tetratricopeptide (TPR) repeat protein
MAKLSKKKKTISPAGSLSPLLAKESLQKSIKRRVSSIWLPLLLAVAAFLVYWPSLKSDFVYDARREMLEEGFITSISNLPAVLSLKVLNMPLMLGSRPGQMLYLMLNAAVWGTKPFGYHLSSNLLHAANVALLYMLLFRLVKTEIAGLDRSDRLKVQLAVAAVTLIFAVHPIAVESVAEVSFSSSLLVTFFTLLALLVATAFHPENLRVAWLTGCLGTLCAVAAVTCKESGIATALLLIVYWFLFRRSESRQAWFLFLGAASAATAAFLAARFLFPPPPDPADGGYLGGSFFNVFAAQPRLWVFMMGKLLCPIHLSVDYTLEDLNAPSTLPALAILIVVFLLQAWLAIKSRMGALGVAIYWLGLVTVSNFVPLIHPVADRFYYLPLAGVAMQLLALLLMTLRSPRGFWMAGTPFVAALLPLAFLTVTREAVFASDFNLWSDTLQVSPRSARAHDGLGWVLFQKGQVDDAIVQFQEAVKISPTFANASHNLGIALIKEGKIDEAITQYQRALQINPHDVQACLDLGDALSKKGQMDEAIAQYRNALEINDASSPAHYDLGLALFREGRTDEAIAQYQKALEIQPNIVQILNNLALALIQRGQMDEATVEYKKILEIDPNFPPAHYNVGLACLRNGQVDDAIQHLQKAVEMDPYFPEAYYNLGIGLLRRGEVRNGMENIEKAIDLQPDYAQAYNTLGLVFAQNGQLDKAIILLEAAVRVKPDYKEAQDNLAQMKAMTQKRLLSK